MAPKSADLAGQQDGSPARYRAMRECARTLRLRVAVLTGASLLTFLAATEVGATVGTWNFIGAAPGSRDHQASAYGNGQTVVFGGLTGATPLGDTQVLSGGTWNQAAVGDPNSPTPRYGAAMAYDAQRGVFVLFGGTDGGPTLDPQTYEFNGTSWNQLNVPGPPPRSFHAMAYNPDTHMVMLFGGVISSGALQDTWEWNGTSWQPIPTTGAIPPKRGRHALAYDPSSHRLVVYGGLVGFTLMDDAYALKGAMWTSLCNACTLVPRFSHALAYDSRQHGIMLFGGRTVFSAYLNDLWILPDGAATWTQIPSAITSPPPPPPRAGHGLVYDQFGGRTLLIGGTNGADLPDTTWQLSVVGNKCQTAAECAGSSCVDGTCCTSACAEMCHSCNIVNAVYSPPVKDGICRGVSTPQNPDRPNDCKSTTRECVGRCIEPGKCLFPGTETPCGRPERCLACNPLNGVCDQLPASRDDVMCAPPSGVSVPSCSEADNSCRTYAAPTVLHRCLDIRKCGWRWSDCTNTKTDTCPHNSCPPN